MASSFRILDSINAEIRDQLLDNHRILNIPANHQVVFEADWGDEAYILSSGIAKARHINTQGDETVISLMGPGSIIGEVALLSPTTTRSVDVVSITTATLLKLRHRALQEAMETSAEFIQAIARLQAQRLCSLGERLILMSDNATTRLMATLMQLALLNSSDDDPLHPIPTISQNEIALIAGLSRGTASTLINKLRANGTLEQSDLGLRFSSLKPLQRRGLLPTIKPTSNKT